MTQEGSTLRSGPDSMIAVLYVDDEPALLEIGKRFLERTGQLVVDTLPSAHEALRVIGEKQYDAIVSDYLMPGMNGIEFLAEIRASGNTIPFIIFTGRGREDVVIKAINTGVNFYLQKGGDPSSQFAELEHKILQAVQQRRAETRIRDYERREADILNFLPDATLAIDINGVVIAWNRAMEEMTGVPANTMLGKGDYEYALPFYGKRRPILIDLIFSDPDEIRTKYAGIVRDGTTLAAETSLPYLRGEQRTLWGKASLLFNQSGTVIGAIEVIRDLTGRKQVEETLRASESRLRYMLGFSGMAERREHELLAYAIEGGGVVTGSPLGYLAFVNDEETELRMYAWSMAAMEECSLQEKPLIYPLETTGLWGEAIRQRRPILTNDYGAPNPKKKGYPDGHPSIIRHMNIPVFDGDRVVIVAGVANKPADYTDSDVRQLTLLIQGLWQVLKRRRAEEELRAANEQLTASDEELRSQLDEVARAQEERARTEQNFRLLVENAPDAIYIQTGGRFVYLNQAALWLLGASSAGDLLGGNIYDRIHSSYHEVVRGRVRTLTADADPVPPLEEVYVKLDGSPVDVEVTAVPVMYEGEGGVLVMLRDITGRKWAERALRESEEKYRALIELAPDAVLVHRDGKVMFANPECIRLAGVGSVDDLIGRDLLPFVHPDDRQSALDQLRQIGKGRFVPLQEMRLLKADGQPFTVQITGRPIMYQGLLSVLTVFRDITAKKQAEEALRGSEEKYRTLVEATSDFIWETDAAGVYTYASPQIRGMLGYEPDDLIGRTPFDLMPPDEAERVGGAFRQYMEGHLPIVAIENRNVRRDGSEAIFETSAVPRFGRDGSFEGYRGIDRDITGRKRAEEALREKSEELDRFFSTSLDLFCIADTDGYFRRLNPEWEKALGYPLADLEERQFLEFVHPDDLQGTLAAIGDLSNQKEVLNFTNRYRHRDGTYRWIEWRSIPSGTTIYAAARDITWRKQVEEALRESEERYRSVIENIEDGFIRNDREGRLMMASPSATRMFGFASADEMIGESVVSIYRFPQERVKLLEELIKNGSVRDYEIEFRRRDGSLFWGSISAHFLYDEDGAVSGTEAVIRDITERKNMENALRLANRKLLLLASTTRHDMVNQITVLQGYLALSRDRLADPEALLGCIDREEQAAACISSLLQFMKEYEQIGIYAPVWGEIKTLVKTAAGQVVPGNITVECMVPAGYDVLADPLIARVFSNLMENAIRHGGSIMTIRFSVEDMGGTSCIVCEDDGSGIPAGEKEKIFEQGFGKGTGLGLFLSREILAITGITIRETGEPGRGARFEITVPDGAWRVRDAPAPPRSV